MQNRFLPGLCTISGLIPSKMSDFERKNPKKSGFKSCICYLTHYNSAAMDRKVSGAQDLWPADERLTQSGEERKLRSIQFTDSRNRFNLLSQITSVVSGRVGIRSWRSAKSENIPRGDFPALAPNFATLPT